MATITGADDEAGTYRSPRNGYGVSWDVDDWRVVQELSRRGGRDRLDLAGVDTRAILYIEGSEEWSDPDDCVDTLTGEVTGFDIDDAEPVEDDEGDPFTIEEDDRAGAAYVYQDGGRDTLILVACRADPDGDVIVAFTFLSAEIDSVNGDGYPGVEAIIDSVVFSP